MGDSTNKKDERKGPTIFDGPFDKVSFEFKHDENEKRDSLIVRLLDANGQAKETVFVMARVSPMDNAVLLEALNTKGDSF